ncbi:mannose-1-phosphate guanyltransferase, partial [Patescibacteria group bacterium]|nr:mannose-1-phosphate guanyltransferase [Patescibacteria group bacterium]
MAKAKHYIVILCGGTGPRLWPLSRTANPKQFLPLLDKQSLLQQTISRCQKVVPLSQIFLISHIKYLAKIKKHLGHKFPPQNIISEPDKRNTAMAILYATAVI